MSRVFINLSNHPSDKWSREQREAAEEFGTITDMPFPKMDPHDDTEVWNNKVEEYLERILTIDENPVVMIQGEFVFTYRLVTVLKQHGIKVVVAETERVSEEEILPDGSTVRRSVFQFVRFLEY